MGKIFKVLNTHSLSWDLYHHEKLKSCIW